MFNIIVLILVIVIIVIRHIVLQNKLLFIYVSIYIHTTLTVFIYCYYCIILIHSFIYSDNTNFALSNALEKLLGMTTLFVISGNSSGIERERSNGLRGDNNEMYPSSCAYDLLLLLLLLLFQL
jgi:hypothetical protein